MRRRDLLKAASVLPVTRLAAPAVAQTIKPLRFVPQANLTALDPIWTTAVVTYNHAYMIYDKLYGWDGSQIQPQMVDGHNVSQDQLTWTFTLRHGLMFHDNEPVRARDCAMSIRRWGSRDSFGQVLMHYVNDIIPLDDRRFNIRLKTPFPQLLFGFGARQCFMMPERDAVKPGSEQVTTAIGSGPYRFLHDEWTSGVRAAYAKFEGYVPRQEPPRFFAGGKVAHFDRVEWIVQPDPATAAAALQKNEVDWIETPLVDLLLMLNKSPGVYTKIIEPGGWAMFMQVNHLYPPFDKLQVRQAVLAALDQQVFAAVAAGDQPDLAVIPTGLFAPTMPMGNTAGMEFVTAPRDIAKARRMVAESGYKGEPIILMSPSDQAMQGHLSEMARELFESIGLRVDYQVMDWGRLVNRRASQNPPEQGGWGAFISVISPLTGANPGSMPPLHGVGRKGWFGWPTDERLEDLRAAWFDAPDLESQRRLAERIQVHFFETAPFFILCRVRTPMALRTDIQDVVSASFPMFWGVRRV